MSFTINAAQFFKYILEFLFFFNIFLLFFLGGFFFLSSMTPDICEEFRKLFKLLANIDILPSTDHAAMLMRAIEELWPFSTFVIMYYSWP